MEKTVSSQNAPERFSALLQGVSVDGDRYVVERDGVPLTAVVPVALYAQWKRRKEDFFGRIREAVDRAARRFVSPTHRLRGRPNGPLVLIRWVETTQFGAGIGGRERPVDREAGDVAAGYPGGDGRVHSSSVVQAEVARAVGSHHVSNYKTDDVAERACEITGMDGGVDQVIEVAFAKNLDHNAAVVKPNGVIATYMIHKTLSRPLTFNLQQLQGQSIAVRLTFVFVMSSGGHATAALDLNAALAAGALKLRTARRFPLDGIADAHELQGAPGMGGKAVIDIGS